VAGFAPYERRVMELIRNSKVRRPPRTKPETGRGQVGRMSGGIVGGEGIVKIGQLERGDYDPKLD